MGDCRGLRARALNTGFGCCSMRVMDARARPTRGVERLDMGVRLPSPSHGTV